MYCSRSLSVTDRLMSLTNTREKDVMNPPSENFKTYIDISDFEKDDNQEWYSDGLFKFQDTLDNEDTNMIVINQEPCDNNVSQTLNELNEEMINLRMNDENVIVNKNSTVSQLTKGSQEESIPTPNNAYKDMNHNDKVNSGHVLEDDLHLFNSNIYWHISPDIPLDPSIIAGQELSRAEPSNLITVSTI